MTFESLSKLEFSPDNLVHIPDDPLALKPIPDIFPELVKVDLDWPPPEDARINFPLSADAEFEMGTVSERSIKGSSLEMSVSSLEGLAFASS